MILLLCILLAEQGYLNVEADRDSMPVFVDNDFIGLTPIHKYALPLDEYNVGFFPQDSVEEASWQLKDGHLSALWKIAKYSEGIVKVRIAKDKLSTVTLNYKKVEQAPGKTKLKVFGCIGGAFLLGVLTTLAVQAVF